MLRSVAAVHRDARTGGGEGAGGDAARRRMSKVRDRPMLRSLTLLLVASSTLAVAALAGRVWRTGTPEFSFLLWNLALAWVPYACAVSAAAFARARPGWSLVPLGALWLIFLPNAPYMVTDLVHLRDGSSFVWWYDAGMILAFAAAGCLLAFAALGIMQSIVSAAFGTWAGRCLVVAATALSALGVWLGRVSRRNSWDLFTSPGATVREAASHLVHPLRHPEATAFIALFSACLLVSYAIFRLGVPRLSGPLEGDRGRSSSA